MPTLEEFIEDAKARGKSKEETFAKYQELKAQGFFEEKPMAEVNTENMIKGGTMNAIDSALLGWGDELVANLNTAGEWLGSGGKVDFADRYAKNKAKLQGYKNMYEDQAGGYSTLGDVGGGLLTAALIPGGMTVRGGAAIGGGEGLVQYLGDTDFEDMNMEDALKRTGTSAAFGGGTQAVGNAIAKFVNPNLSALNPERAAEVKRLERLGINPTIGQRLGGAFDKIEQAGTSLPFAGNKIQNARKEVQEQFNKNAIEEALAPIDGKVTSIGNTGFSEADDLVNEAYQTAKNVNTGFNLDQEAAQNLRKVHDMAKSMTPPEAQAFQKFWQDKVVSRFSKAGGITSQSFKDLESELGRKIKNTSGELQDAYKQVQHEIREALMRTDGEMADAFRKANAAYRNLFSIKNATNAAAVNDGVFTPGQLVRGSKAADMSKGKRLSARGEAPLQKTGQQAQDIIGDTLPTSGTSERALVAAGLAFPSWIASDPTLAALTATGVLSVDRLYTKQGQKFIIDYLMKSGKTKKYAQDFIKRLTAEIGQTGANPEIYGEQY